MLKVTVAEVERRVLKQLGVSAQNGGETILKGGWGQLVQQNPFAINSPLTASALTINGNNNTTATLKAYERYGVSRVLAEPTVTAISGEVAKFTVGGEVAVPGNSSCISGVSYCAPSIMFKPYGVSLNFTPVVLAQGRILLHLATEVTEVDYQAAQSYGGITGSGLQDTQERDQRRAAVRRLDRHGRPDHAKVRSGDQRPAGADQPSRSRRLVPLARLSAQRDRAADRRDALHRPAARRARRRRVRTTASPTPPIRRRGCSAASTGSTPIPSIRRWPHS